MPVVVSNPRDLFVLLLGEILHVERRLAGEVLQTLVDDARDEQLKNALREHLEETRRHVERVETVFRRIEVAPAAFLSRPFESAAAEHADLAAAIVEPRLADLFHAQAAIHTEQWELAAYDAALVVGEAMGLEAHLDELRLTVREEERARDALLSVAEALARAACARSS